MKRQIFAQVIGCFFGLVCANFVINEYKDERYLLLGFFNANIYEDSELHRYLSQQNTWNRFELSFSKGLWDYKRDGYLEHVSPIGASLSCSHSNSENLAQHFKYLVHSLASFSASGIDVFDFDGCVMDSSSNTINALLPEIRPSADLYFSFLRNIDWAHKNANGNAKKFAVFILAHIYAILEGKCVKMVFEWDKTVGTSQIKFGLFAFLNAFEEYGPSSKLLSALFESASANFGAVPYKRLFCESAWLAASMNIVEKSTSNGTFWLRFANAHKTATINVRVKGVLPAFMNVNYALSEVALEDGTSGQASQRCLFDLVHFSFGRHVLYEAEFVLKPRQSLKISLGYQIKMANFSQYPYDANRGVDIFCPFIEVSRDNAKFGVQNIVIPSAVLPLFQPDFSMPYNIMIIAFSISIIYLLALRKATSAIVDEKKPIEKLMLILKRAFTSAPMASIDGN